MGFLDFLLPARRSTVQLDSICWSRLTPTSPSTPPIYLDTKYKPNSLGVYPEVTHVHLTLSGFSQTFDFYTQDIGGADIASLSRYTNIPLYDFWLMSYSSLLEQRQPNNDHRAQIWDWSQDSSHYTYCLIFTIGGDTYHLRTSDENPTLAHISDFTRERLRYSKTGFGGK